MPTETLVERHTLITRGGGFMAMGGRQLRPKRQFALPAVLFLLLATSEPGSAATALEERVPSSPLGLTCRDLVSDDGIPYRRCDGDVPSFDGLPLSTTVTLPAEAQPPLPLIVFRHGSHTDKTEWHDEPDDLEDLPSWKKDWNNVAFATRGYAVLTSTSRGWFDSCGPMDRANPQRFADECEGRRYWVHGMDPRWEVRDVQTLIGLLVDEGWVDPSAIGVYGLSMGSMETWLLALLNNRTMDLDGRLRRWRSPSGVLLRIAAAVPEAFFAAPAYGYAPNGRARDDTVPSLETLSAPFGVVVESWMVNFCAFFAGTAELAPPGADPSADIASWCRRLLQGNPFRNDAVTDPDVARFIEETQIRSALRYLPTRPRVPIFIWQGLTDSITTGIHGVMMLNWLRALDPNYPVKAAFDDNGHQPASNTDLVYARLIKDGQAFFAYHLLGQGEHPTYNVTASSPECASGDGTKVTLTVARWRDLTTRTLTLASNDDRYTASHAGIPLVAADGFDSSPCTPVTVAESTGAAGWTFEIDEGFLLAGAPELTVRYTASGTDPKIDVRLWDVSPDGLTQKLVSRGTYRQEGSPSGSLTTSFQLWPAVWPIEREHSLRLEITGNDSPYFQQNNTPFVLHIESVALRVPISTQAVPS